MDLRFLQSLVAVIETGSIAAAARREKLTAAAVSQRIQALERDLGCVLLLRAAHTVQPTDLCLDLVPRARRLLREAADLRAGLAASGISGELRIGAISTALVEMLPPVLDALVREAPALNLYLVPGTSQRLYDQVLSGELDAAILVSPPFSLPKALTLTSLKREPLVYVSRDPVPAAEIALNLQQQPFIRYDAQSWGGRLVADYLRDRDLAPQIRFDMDAPETIVKLVARGIGHALLPRWTDFAADGVHAVAVPDAEAYGRRIVLLTSRLSRRERALALLTAALTQEVATGSSR